MFTYALSDLAFLRILNVQDAEECFALVDANREHLRPWLPWVDNTLTPADSRAFIEFTSKQVGNNNGFQAGIFYEDKLVGMIGFHSIDWAHKKTTIGYWLAEGYQGRGLMTSACRALIDYAFDVWKLNRIEIRATVQNVRSRAIPERLGFTLEGTVRQVEWVNDRFYDHVVYGLLAEDWKK
ncbi:GNAT family N-acetyltransferase [Brevibacillus dissolubilis]|uniref:GNAT family N-acetyltransferase n=1 Tax=Brevibacillus dissolubilis TaxID=1844116 RepID=UPI00111666B6|nr:GNAT family protein [Brevibacillus dissolubilis]